MKEECIFIVFTVSFVSRLDPAVGLERAGNHAAFQGFGWQMLYKTNYPQEDENTLHLPFPSTSGLFFTLFIFEKHVYWER